MNRVVIASAGSGKTTSLVRDTLDSPDESTLILTYTNENLENIRKAFAREAGTVPPNVKISSWYAFLLSEGARPYHNFVSAGPRARTVNFAAGSAGADPARRFIRAADTERYYFDGSRGAYSDKIAEYVCQCEVKSGGKVSARLRGIYKMIFIDEVQDLSGWDLEILRFLLGSGIEVVVVGYPRQATYSTNNSNKNSQYKGAKIVDFFARFQEEGLCAIENQATSHRCNQLICDLADLLYPSLPASRSMNGETTGHDGIFFIRREDAVSYHGEYSPIVLRYDVRANTEGLGAKNFGASKGLTFDRVLVFPTPAIIDFLHTGSGTALADGTRAKLYVAITRAKFSVAFVCEEPPVISGEEGLQP